MPTPLQLRLIHVAARQLRLVDREGDAPYRLLLHNVAGVESSKELDNKSFEDVMAVMEDMGFCDSGHAADYWRGKVRTRAAECGERVLYKIRAMAPASRYPLEALVERVSNHRTGKAEELTPYEGYCLIETLKAEEKREQRRSEGATERQGEELPF